ncbi:MAG TPA: DMT family transporter [Firmicutes bacterium]|nr:DMT family transporter [Bacillota bacterium]
MTDHLLGAIYALIAAVLYGGGDFGGGFASRRLNHYQVLLIFSLVGVVAMAVLALLWNEEMPTATSIINAMLASTFGAFGLATLYKGLASRRACIVAPSSAVIAAGLPVIYGAIVQGLPDNVTLTGFILAAIGIWLTTRGDPSIGEQTAGENAGGGLLIGVLAGLGFGLFFIFMARIEPGPVFSPLIFGKLASIAVALFVIILGKMPLPNPVKNPLALVAGFLDVMANVLYLVSSSLTRPDIAAVLVCTYPAVTVLLSMLFLKEKINRSQGFGVLVCIVAITLIII